MSSPASQVLDAHELLTLVGDALGRIVAGQGGKVSIAQDPVDAGEILAKGPQAFHLVLALGDEEALTADDGHDGAAKTYLSLYVQRAKGLPVKAGSDIAGTTPGATRISLLQLCEDLVQVMRSIAIPCDSRGLRFVRSTWVTTDGTDEAARNIHRTRQIDFSCRRSLRSRFAETLS